MACIRHLNLHFFHLDLVMSLDLVFVAKVAFLAVLIDTNFINLPSASQLSVGFMQSGVMHRHPCKGLLAILQVRLANLTFSCCSVSRRFSTSQCQLVVARLMVSIISYHDDN